MPDYKLQEILKGRSRKEWGIKVGNTLKLLPGPVRAARPTKLWKL